MKNAEGVDEHTKHKAKFYVEQIANALSPTNFAFTNPEVLRTTLATNGANLIEGLKHLEEDLTTPDGRLKIKQTDQTAFEVGKNIATSPGKVIFQNDTLQLIQYAPATEKVYRNPAADRPAVDQQVLHSRSQSEEVLRALGGGAGAHRLRRVVDQSR